MFTERSAGKATTINFDEWATLAKDDPEAFEKRRSEEIEKTISSAPEHMQLKLRQLQWRLDGIRRKHTPLGATVEMSRLMWESFEEMKNQLNNLLEVGVEKPQKPKLVLVK